MRSESAGILHSDVREEQEDVAVDAPPLGRRQLSGEVLEVQEDH